MSWEEKFDQRMSRQLDKDTLLVFREKHGNRYFLVPTIKELYGAALKVLTERYRDGWFYEPDPIERNPTDDLSPEDLDKIKRMSYGEEFIEHYKTYTQEKAAYDQELQDYRDIQKAVKEKDGRMAWNILQSHKDWEYEGVYLESVETIDKEKVTL